MSRWEGVQGRDNEWGDADMLEALLPFLSSIALRSRPCPRALLHHD